MADAISRLDYDPSANPNADCSHFIEMNSKDINHYQWKAVSKMFGNYYTQSKSHKNTNTMSHDCVFANHSEEDDIFPLTVKEISDAQKADIKLKLLLKRNAVLPKGITLQEVEDIQCLCDNNRMIIPKPLQKRATQWYHHYLQHPGHTRLEETINATMYWKGMRTTIRTLVRNCKSCQVNKRRKRWKYGKLPPKNVITNPWETLCVDCIGPYTLKGNNGSIVEFQCLTMIDPASSWFEIVELPLRTVARTRTVMGKLKNVEEQIFDKTSERISRLVYNTWLCRYPRCRTVIYDNGSEFKLNFEDLCDSYGLKRKPTTIKNPQANAILERVHQVLMNMLRTAALDMAETVSPSDIDTYIHDAAWAIRSTYHTVLKASPGSAIFGRDMLFDIPYIANWNKIGDRRQMLTDANNARENKTRRDFDHEVGMKVLIDHESLRKAESPYKKEPWTITQVYTNGTIRVQSGAKSERINIRRVKPFHESFEE